MNNKVITAHVPPPLADKLDQKSAQMERSKNWIIKQALWLWLEQEEYKHQLTLEALADVDANRVVDHQKVKAWVESLDSDVPLSVPQHEN